MTLGVCSALSKIIFFCLEKLIYLPATLVFIWSVKLAARLEHYVAVACWVCSVLSLEDSTRGPELLYYLLYCAGGCYGTARLE